MILVGSLSIALIAESFDVLYHTVLIASSSIPKPREQIRLKQLLHCRLIAPDPQRECSETILAVHSLSQSFLSFFLFSSLSSPVIMGVNPRPRCARKVTLFFYSTEFHYSSAARTGVWGLAPHRHIGAV